ncbi:acetyltransferase, GNAT family [Synechococcus sp. PCC 7335]|uniref:ribosomal protein S18-alanine N-acetyltransferase n=1 Tax=Synechococcus sp. (strain ATCC 29403 / PCC 7335) TaxID=91464 RepID=UPI00017ED62A|nr:ribosomal protein S18-alanine N-acetyltransferase [Synechococcus sp. PCC 7335]EDX84866.1 acetyltransferase, GNAT family [Synechococcus sp. PCC 7335]
MVAADISAVLALDQRCLGGLWTRSGYERELDSEHSDLLVLVKASSVEPINSRLTQTSPKLVSTTEPDDAHTPQTSIQSNVDAQISAQSNTLINTQITPSNPSRKGQQVELLGVGCLWAILEEAHITTLAIDPKYQGQKLGLWLLAQLLQKAYKRGLTRATLEVRATNKRALSLYQKFDFKEAGIRKRYYADGEDASILWRTGLQTKDCLAQINRYQMQATAQLRKQNYRFYTEDFQLI